MITFDASEIMHWADKPDASHKFPELVRRLIMATVPMPSLLDMPSGSSVTGPGWDGLTVVQTGNIWVPKGSTAWEFSCQKTPKCKATEDYEKRTKDPKGVNIATTAFRFITPRRWNGKQKWSQHFQEKAQWADVRALDADDLVGWLEQASAVASWFAKLIGKLPDGGFVPLDEWWECWSSRTDPQISPELVTAGRCEEMGKVESWATGEPASWYVQADTRTEVVAFLAACAHTKTTRWGEPLLSKALVVETADGWKSLQEHTSPLVLIRNFEGADITPTIAIKNGHHVLTALHEHQDPRGNGFKLNRLRRDETFEALTVMGIAEPKARSLMKKTARNLQVLHRLLTNTAGGAEPWWASPSSNHSIVALILIGQWESDHEDDKKVIAKIVGKSYEEIEQDVTDIASTADSPLTKTGNIWHFVSHEEAWYLLAPRLTSTDLQRFQRIVTEIFGTVSPKFEIPIEERTMTDIMGKILPQSNILREGMARSLALMGVYHRVKNADGAQSLPKQVVSSALEAGQGWQIWATLDLNLPVLAEAAPKTFLQAVERDIKTVPSPFEELFAQESGVSNGGALHTGLLWALERLAWSENYYTRVAKILAHLAEIDPGGGIQNRPSESLRSLFLPFIRFSEAPDEQRIKTLRMLLDRVPQAGWQILVNTSSSTGGCINREPPSWRPWAQDGTPKPTEKEYLTFIREMKHLLVDNVQDDADRWADLIGTLPRYCSETRQQIIKLLAQRIEAVRRHPTSNNLWSQIRRILYYQRSSTNSDGVMDPTDLETVYRELMPSDPVAAYSWLFDSWPNLPEGTSFNNDEMTSRICEKRKAAVQATFESGGTAAILDLAEAAELPFLVGRSAAVGLDKDLIFGLAPRFSGEKVSKLRNFVTGAFTELFSQFGWKVLEEALTQTKSVGSKSQALADIYLAAPALPDTWQRLETESQEVQQAYWKEFQPDLIDLSNQKDIAFVTLQLLAHNRSFDTIKRLAFTEVSVPHEIIIAVLEQIPTDISTMTSTDSKSHIHSTEINQFPYLSRLFAKLDESEDVPDEVIAKLEILYIKILSPARSNLALYREITKEPSLFADLISLVAKSSGGQAEEGTDERTRQNRCQIADSILSGLRRLPGLMESGTVDAEALSYWVNEAQRLCKERGRSIIGDQRIGQILANAPTGTDGIWPCEPVRNLLDHIDNSHIGTGFTVGKFNLHGFSSRNTFEGGDQERELEDSYRLDAARITAKWPFTASCLDNLADLYSDKAKRHDTNAARFDRFEA